MLSLFSLSICVQAFTNSLELTAVIRLKGQLTPKPSIIQLYVKNINLLDKPYLCTVRFLGPSLRGA
ncbi:protein of unknown function [Legionella pneumophila subsp. pneumophila]|uniref:Uncharacterized protein n=1 Tax=Legionella pneumophila subsp. pneumophila TaxID=91891 RepID=A0AAV2UWN1_LEGPN|nr:protein of unknown function [Legionella pneumophila subsp. pneumophila]